MIRAVRSGLSLFKSWEWGLTLAFCLGIGSAPLYGEAVLYGEEVQIDALALLPGMAVLNVNGQQRKLRAGEQTEEGVRLVTANSREAVVEFNGVRRTLNLSNAISTRFATPKERRVIIAPDTNHHYYTTGSINGLPVRFLVDTGASMIAMNRNQAEHLGISFRMLGDPGYAQTASGVTPMYSIRLDRVTVGDIELHNVEASVMEGDYPTEILLGMSFLRMVKMQEVDGALHLIRNY